VGSPYTSVPSGSATKSSRITCSTAIAQPGGPSVGSGGRFASRYAGQYYGSSDISGMLVWGGLVLTTAIGDCCYAGLEPLAGEGTSRDRFAGFPPKVRRMASYECYPLPFRCIHGGLGRRSQVYIVLLVGLHDA
jgi:hypothetical protein